MTANPNVIGDLQTTAGLLSTLAEQYAVDKAQLTGIDLDWLKHRVKKWRSRVLRHLAIVLKRLTVFGVDPNFQPGRPQAGGNVQDLLERDLATVQGAFDQTCGFRRNSWNVRADGVPDIYEHIVQDLEKQVFKIERELRLITALGLEGYVAARLEDG